MKTCTKCSTENNDDQKFCISCGSNLQSDLEKFLEAQGISQLASVMKSHDITSLEVLKELGENDLGELGLAYGDKVRIKVAIESLKKPEAPGPPAAPANPKFSQPAYVPPTQAPPSASPSSPSQAQEVDLAAQSRELLRQATQQGINRASQILTSAQQAISSSPSSGAAIPTQVALEDAALLPDVELTYTFIIWGWLTCGILTLVAWWKIFRNRKKVQSELLQAHWKNQNKTCWMYLGIAIVLGIIAGIIEGDSNNSWSNGVGYIAMIWYIRMSWKARKALKAGQLPDKLAAW